MQRVSCKSNYPRSKITMTVAINGAVIVTMKVGRPRLQFNLRTVAALARRDATDQEMADCLRTSLSTISRVKKTRQFREALKRGWAGVDWIMFNRQRLSKRIVEAQTSTLWKLTARARAGIYQQYLLAKQAACNSGVAWEFYFIQWWRLWEESGNHHLYDEHELRLRSRCKRWTARNVEILPILPRALPVAEPQIKLAGTWHQQCAKTAPELPQVVAPKHPIRSNSTADDLDRAGREYRQHKYNARERGIRWRFTLSSWRKTWDQSGHYGERGPHGGQYSMQRILDGDTYSPRTVEIRINDDNVRTRMAKLRFRRGPRIVTRGINPLTVSLATCIEGDLAAVHLAGKFDNAGGSVVESS